MDWKSDSDVENDELDDVDIQETAAAPDVVDSAIPSLFSLLSDDESDDELDDKGNLSHIKIS